MEIRLCKNNKISLPRKGKYIDKEIAKQLIDISRGVRAFREQKYAKTVQYLEKKALNPKAVERIKFMVGTSYVETKIHEKEASELLKSIIQKYKDEPKEKRPYIYTGAILEYAKIQLRNELTEFAIYLLEDINTENKKYNIYALTELAKAYDMQAQELRRKEKIEEALEIEKKSEKTCLECLEISKGNEKLTIEARILLGILFVRQGNMDIAKQEFEQIKKINPEYKFNVEDSIEIFKKTYFKEESEEEVNRRIKRLEKKLEAIENGEEEEIKEYARDLNVVSRIEYFEELSPELKISNGLDIFTGYKMYEYPKRGVIVIDKMFNEIKDEQKILGFTYIFPTNMEFNIEKISRLEVMKMLDKNTQKQEHKGDYYNSIQEKMKRAELEGLVIEEKKLKEKESEIEKTIRKENTKPEENEEEGEQ